MTFIPIANSILFDNAAFSFCFPRSQPTAASVLDKLLTSDNDFYTATPKLASRAEYFAGRQKNILVVKGKDTDEEFIIRGVFQTSRNNFHFTPDANFDPENVFQGRFADVKLNCRLTAGRDEDFTFSSQDFSAIADNFRALERLVTKERH
jgi:hypothetical protein